MSRHHAPNSPSAPSLGHLRALAACNANVIAPFGLTLDCQRLRLLAEAEAGERLRPKWLIQEASLWRPALGRRSVSDFELLEPFRLFDPPALVELLHGLQEAAVLPPPSGHIRRTAVVGVRDLHRQNLVLLKALHFDHVVVRVQPQQPLAEAWSELVGQGFERCSLALGGNGADALARLLEALAQYRPIRAQLPDVTSFDEYMSAPALTALLMQLQYFRAGPTTAQRFNSLEVPIPRHRLELGPGGGGWFGGYSWRNVAAQDTYTQCLQADQVPVDGTGAPAGV